MTFAHAQDAAMGNLGYERKTADWYPTPAWVTEAVIPFLHNHRSATETVWEPACGDGAMSKVLWEHFRDVWSSDLHDYGYRDGEPGQDFLAVPDDYCVRNNIQIICTNPPYGDLAEQFIRKALALTKPVGGMVAMLLRNEYDCAAGRNDLFGQAPFARKVVLLNRPRWIEGSTGAPRHNYSFFIWDWEWHTPAVISFARKGK